MNCLRSGVITNTDNITEFSREATSDECLIDENIVGNDENLDTMTPEEISMEI